MTRVRTKINRNKEAAISDSPKAQELRPPEFMRARRPELFSDSKIVSEPRLTREIFSYHLETLTNRKEEAVFEYFARRLAEKEVCPNLLPQTGPTGGGDSKVDTETYPVAERISLGWYEGLEKRASSERWAFALSAKKNWRSKVQSDVKKIAETGRDYKQIFFISSQFVRDKERAEVEDSLKEKYGIPVRILDRSWILAAVFERGRMALAIETLNLQGYDELERKVVGPLDLEREAELKSLDEQIADSARYEGVDYQLAEDCLQSALLARALGRPRTEVDGRFQRAEGIAEKLDHRQQRLRIAYQKAWTAFWWYEDFELLNRLYDEIEQFAVNSQQVTNLELLGNIWSLLMQSVRGGRLDPDAAKFESRTKTLKAEFERLAAETSRPNNALQARTHLLLIALAEAVGNPQLLDEVLIDLGKIIQEAEGLTAYPLEPIARIIRELGDVFAESAAYDELFETVVSVTERRTSQGETGRLLLERGYQKLRGGQTYDAIRLLGRAQQKLALREYRQEMVAALVGCGLAYETAGLLWAARANVVAAANQALSEYWEHGEILPQALSCLRKLVWIELQLGRIPCVLQWMELSFVIAEQLLRTEERKQRFIDERELQDRILAILLLRTDFWELKWLDFFPNVLERFGLDYSRMALLYALGHEEILRSEGSIPEKEDDEAVLNFFNEWANDPSGSDLPERPELLEESKVHLRSYVLGCEVTINAANNLQSVQLGETILATLESLLATSLDSELLPFVSQFTIDIQPFDMVDEWPTYEIDQGDLSPSIRLRHAPNLSKQISEDQGAFREWLNEFVIKAISRIVIIQDIESWGRRLFRDEAGMGRALNFSETIIPVSNLLGESPKFKLSDWEPEDASKRYPLQRTAPWNQDVESQKVTTDPLSGLKPGTGKIPPDLLDFDKVKHKSRRVYSLVNLPLWDKAEWQGIAYFTVPDQDWPPRVGLGFKNPDAGKAIFKGWLDKLGRIDREDALRISIITGINKEHPFHYKVVVGTNPQVARNDSSSSHLVLVSRIHVMTPPDSRNLDMFRREYDRLKKYVLIPAHFVDPQTEPTPYWDFSIGKTEIRIVPAWQIGEHDPDVIAIQEDANPIIPDGIEDAPVLSALARFERHQQEAAVDEPVPSEVSELLSSHAEELASDRKGIRMLFEYLSRDQLKGHWSCYCGSGKKLRQCHIDDLSQLRKKINVDTAQAMLEKISKR